ncbi:MULTISPECIES: hypothetical protein [unclassified Kribbella]|uniref:hypothetical protein n=1 Tax=unclassified Kribbella TaxID=2644121 RepID=UPI003017F8FE
MDYDGFDAEYGRVLEAAGSLDLVALALEVERLRTLVETVHPVADQEAARMLMISLDSALSSEQPPLSDAMSEALRVHRQARTAQGSADERMEGLHAAIAEIGRIADTAEPAEHGRILDLNESLSMLLESLQITADRVNR